MPEQIIREIPRIARYCRHNAAADWRFLTQLKTDGRYSDAQIDAIVHEETERVWSKIDCLACGNCCRTLQIVVDDNDIRRLASRLGISAHAFSKRYVTASKTERSKHFTSTPCAFLGEDNRCTVYEDRPQACRDFPYLHAQKFRSRALTMLGNLPVCPIVFNVWQALKQRLGRSGGR